MNVVTVSIKIYMTHEFCIKQPMQLVELMLNRLFDFNRHLITALDRSVNQPLIRKHSYIVFNQKQFFILKRPNQFNINKFFPTYCINFHNLILSFRRI